MTIQGFAVLRDRGDCPDEGEWTPNTVHLRDDIPMPSVDDVPGNTGVLIRILQVGLCGTDKEINGGLYGNGPEHAGRLVIGHESFGQVVDVARGVSSLKNGDLVVVTVRRPSPCFLSKLRFQDLTSRDEYFERGISQLDGFLCEFVAEDEEYIVKVCDAGIVGTPEGRALEAIGVLSEPMSIAQKAIRTAWAMQSARLPFYRPETALVLGAGPIGQLAALTLRLRGLEVTLAAGKPAKNNPRADAAAAIGAHYTSTRRQPLAEVFDDEERFDIVFDATGNARIAFDSLRRVAKNGIVIWNSITGGEKTFEIPGNQINQEFVLGNKLLVGTVNAHLGDWDTSIDDFARANEQYSDWLAGLITDIGGFDEDTVKSYLHWPTTQQPEPATALPLRLRQPIKAAVKLGEAERS